MNTHCPKEDALGLNRRQTMSQCYTKNGRSAHPQALFIDVWDFYTCVDTLDTGFIDIHEANGQKYSENVSGLMQGPLVIFTRPTILNNNTDFLVLTLD